MKAGKGRLQGFGHRVYKNYDPRATIIKQTADEVFEVTGKNPLLDIALKLEEVALSDDYFISRKLYPNVDFYSGLIYQAMGFPMEMFTVLFAIPRTSGWLAHWHRDARPGLAHRPAPPAVRRRRGPRLRPDVLPLGPRWVIPIAQVDAFTDRPFGGNPAAVCLLDGPADEQWMQSVAAEMQPVGDGVPRGPGRRRRPVPRGGCAGSPRCRGRPVRPRHAGGRPPSARRSGRSPAEVAAVRHACRASLTARQIGDGWIELDFPADPPVEAEAPGGLLEALGITEAVTVARGRSDWLVEVPCAEEVRATAPDFASLAAVAEVGRGVIVTAVGDGLARHRLPVLRAGRGHRRGPGHRLGPLPRSPRSGPSGWPPPTSWPTRPRPGAA